MRNAALPLARGSTARATLDFLRRTFGEAELQAVLAALDDADRTELLAASATDDLPYDRVLALWEAAERRLGRRHPDWMERAGAFAIESLGQQLYGGLLHKSSPVEFVTQSVSLFRLYYSQGDIQAVEVEPGRAVLRLVGFDAMGTLFCRRQTGGLACATRLAGGRNVRVRHVRCGFEGDAYCEWELRWE